MKTLLHGFHAIAAQRGDGLRPEFLEMMSPSRMFPNIGEMENGAGARDHNFDRRDAAPECESCTEVVILPVRRR